MLQEVKIWHEKLTTGAALGSTFYQEHKHLLPKDIQKIAFIGMGGSGIAGRIIKTFLDKTSAIPSFIIDGTDIPAYIDQHTLVFVTSYSGNTWEILVALKTLIQKNIPTIVLTHGGSAQEVAQEHQIPWIKAPVSRTPRSALGSFLGILLTIFDHLNILPGSLILRDFHNHLDQHMETLSKKSTYDSFLNLAKNRDFFHLWGISGDSAACAYRAQTQFNENSKVQAIASTFPELCHNLLVGFTKPTSQPLVILLHTDFISDNYKQTLGSITEVLQERGVALYKPNVLGNTLHGQLFHIVLWADVASCYLGQVNGVDLESVVLIDQLKEKHKQKGITF